MMDDIVFRMFSFCLELLRGGISTKQLKLYLSNSVGFASFQGHSAFRIAKYSVLIALRVFFVGISVWKFCSVVN